jgi:hypothetical protein
MCLNGPSGKFKVAPCGRPRRLGIFALFLALLLSPDRHSIAQATLQGINAFRIECGGALQPTHTLRKSYHSAWAVATLRNQHALARISVRRAISENLRIGIGGSVYATRSVIRIETSFTDSLGTRTGNNAEDTGLTLNPYSIDGRIFYIGGVYRPYQLELTVSRRIPYRKHAAFEVEWALGITPTSGALFQSIGVADSADETWQLAKVSSQNDGYLNPYLSLSASTHGLVGRKSTLIISVQLLSSVLPFYDRELSMERATGSSTGSSIPRRLMWLALTVGYELQWGKPPTPREKRDLRGRAPYWPG